MHIDLNQWPSPSKPKSQTLPPHPIHSFLHISIPPYSLNTWRTIMSSLLDNHHRSTSLEVKIWPLHRTSSGNSSPYLHVQKSKTPISISPEEITWISGYPLSVSIVIKSFIILLIWHESRSCCQYAWIALHRRTIDEDDLGIWTCLYDLHIPLLWVTG